MPARVKYVSSFLHKRGRLPHKACSQRKPGIWCPMERHISLAAQKRSAALGCRPGKDYTFHCSPLTGSGSNSC